MFQIKGNPQLNKESFSFNERGNFPYFTRTAFNNSILGYVDYLDEEHKIEGNCLAVGMIAMQFFFMEKDFYAGQFTKRAVPISFTLTPRIATYLISLMNRNQEAFQNVLVRDFERIFYKAEIQLPMKKGKIDFAFMESFVSTLERERIMELEAYLSATGLKDYTLTVDEQQVFRDFEDGNIRWQAFNVEKLFGKSTRGKRLKSADRIYGTLPFVTAGEAQEGISAFVGNDVTVFSNNTTTIDMFGSAKYRNYRFGGDDHIAVVHTEKLPKFAAVFVASAIHKSSHTGKFDYGRNFYSKDADELNILLPVHNEQPNYMAMETFISAIQKIVIKELVIYAEQKIADT